MATCAERKDAAERSRQLYNEGNEAWDAAIRLAEAQGEIQRTVLDRRSRQMLQDVWNVSSLQDPKEMFAAKVWLRLKEERTKVKLSAIKHRLALVPSSREAEHTATYTSGWTWRPMSRLEVLWHCHIIPVLVTTWRLLRRMRGLLVALAAMTLLAEWMISARRSWSSRLPNWFVNRWSSRRMVAVKTVLVWLAVFSQIRGVNRRVERLNYSVLLRETSLLQYGY